MLKVDPPKAKPCNPRFSAFKWSLIFIFGIFLVGAYPVWIFKIHAQPKWGDLKVAKKLVPIPNEKEKKPKTAKEIEQLRIVEDKISKNDTFAVLLDREGVGSKTIHKIVHAALPVFNLNRIRRGNLYRIAFDSNNQLLYLDYSLNDEQYLRVKRDGTSFKPALLEVFYDIETEIIEGEIRYNLISDLRRVGGSVMMAFELAEIFSWDIDFFKDIRRGDFFELLVEKKIQHGRFVGYGKILAARFINQGEEYTAVYFENQTDNGSYFDLNGKPLEKQFLKAPLKFRRISSYFTHRRYHPVYKAYLPHRSIDYAAPIGTPILAVADGRIQTLKRNSRSGKHVIIKHNNIYKTSYSHMTRFAKGIKKGTRVHQGQVIGYVGQTGSATGPHLCFRMTRYGEPINPLRFKSPEGKPIHPSLAKVFQRTARDRLVLFGKNQSL
tara:strand:+ start:416 stop:1726 length:1311 start_codon:yes stop_codon:yes gene_type:complete